MDASTIIQALGGSDLAERRQAAEACAKDAGLATAAAIPLCHCCAAPDEQLREWANGALEDMGPPSVDELDALIELFHAAEPTAYWGVTLVGRLEAEGSPALPRLVQVIDQKGTPDEVRNRAIWAIGKIGVVDPPAREVLSVAAQSENPRTARLAASVLEKH